MLQNPMVIDFIASELLRENQQDGGGGWGNFTSPRGGLTCDKTIKLHLVMKEHSTDVK